MNNFTPYDEMLRVKNAEIERLQNRLATLIEDVRLVIHSRNWEDEIKNRSFITAELMNAIIKAIND